MRFYATSECRALLVRCERHRGHRTSAVVNRDGEAITDAKRGGFFEKLLLRVRQISRFRPMSPFERLSDLQCLADDRIKALVMVAQVVASPRQRIGRDQAGLVILAMRQAEVGKAGQFKSRCRARHGGAQARLVVALQ